MIKIFTIAMITCVISITATAQMTKGTLLIGGTLGFNRTVNTNTEELKTKYLIIYLSPTIGTFYRTNRMAGINLQYSRATYTDEFHNNNSYGGGVFLRQYQPLGKLFYIFAEEGISASTGKFKRYSNAQQNIESHKQSAANLYFYPGIAYSVTRKIQFELALNQLFYLNYNQYSIRSVDAPVPYKSKNNSVSMQSGFTQNGVGFLSFGMKWML